MPKNAHQKHASKGQSKGLWDDFNLGRALEDILGLLQLAKGAGSKAAKVAPVRGIVVGELEKVLKKMGVVTRAELDAVKAIAIAARMQSEDVAEFVGYKKRAPAAQKKTAQKKPARKTPKKK